MNDLPKVATQCNSGTTRESNGGPRVQILSVLTTKPLSHNNGRNTEYVLLQLFLYKFVKLQLWLAELLM